MFIVGTHSYHQTVKQFQDFFIAELHLRKASYARTIAYTRTTISIIPWSSSFLAKALHLLTAPVMCLLLALERLPENIKIATVFIQEQISGSDKLASWDFFFEVNSVSRNALQNEGMHACARSLCEFFLLQSTERNICLDRYCCQTRGRRDSDSPLFFAELGYHNSLIFVRKFRYFKRYAQF